MLNTTFYASWQEIFTGYLYNRRNEYTTFTGGWNDTRTETQRMNSTDIKSLTFNIAGINSGYLYVDMLASINSLNMIASASATFTVASISLS